MHGAGWIDTNSEVWCERYWMEGVPHKALNLVNEFRLESTPLVALPVKPQLSPRVVPGRSCAQCVKREKSVAQLVKLLLNSSSKTNRSRMRQLGIRELGAREKKHAKCSR
jgi:hypothetical protein